MGNQKTATVSTSEGDVVVRKLVIADYAELLKLLQTLPNIFNQIAGIDEGEWTNAKVVELVPQLMANALPETIKLIAFPIDKDEDFINQLGPTDILDLVDSFLTVNDFERIVSSLKKIRGRVSSPSMAPKPNKVSTTGSIAP